MRDEVRTFVVSHTSYLIPHPSSLTTDSSLDHGQSDVDADGFAADLVRGGCELRRAAVLQQHGVARSERAQGRIAFHRTRYLLVIRVDRRVVECQLDPEAAIVE